MASQAEQTSFLFAQNAHFIGDLFAKFKNDPSSVDESWRRFFGQMNGDDRVILEELAGPSWGLKNGTLAANADGYAEALALEGPAPLPADTLKAAKGGAAAQKAPAGAALEDLKARHDGLDRRPAADPRLSRPRPPGGRPRPSSG